MPRVAAPTGQLRGNSLCWLFLFSRLDLLDNGPFRPDMSVRRLFDCPAAFVLRGVRAVP